VVLKVFVAGPTEANDSIRYHIIHAESTTDEEFFSSVRPGQAEVTNERNRLACRKHPQEVRKLRERAKAERIKTSRILAKTRPALA
jgi:hypothetical protein